MNLRMLDLGLVTVMITILRQTQTTSTLYTVSSIFGAIVLRLEEDRKVEIGAGSSIGSSLISSFLASALRGESEGRDRNGRNGGPRVVRVGGRNGDGNGNGNGGNPGNGIDIHIHMLW